jgi:hypothetical protein
LFDRGVRTPEGERATAARRTIRLVRLAALGESPARVPWLARLPHPKPFPEPSAVLQRLHALHYHREPSEAQLRTLLQAAGLTR